MSDLNFDELEKEFNLEKTTKKISLMRETLDELDESLDDSNEIIKSNIRRANRLLDAAENQLEIDFNSRILEGCSRLIAEITTAANVLINNDIQNQNFDIKERTLDLKEFEVKLKAEKMSELPINQTNIQQNIVLTDRESLLKMLSDNSDQVNDIILDS